MDKMPPATANLVLQLSKSSVRTIIPWVMAGSANDKLLPGKAVRSKPVRAPGRRDTLGHE